MISIYQFGGMSSLLSDHIAFSMRGHPSTALVIEALDDCIHTLFYYTDERLKNVLLAHQQKGLRDPLCKKNQNYIINLKHENPLGVMALRRYRGEGNNRIVIANGILMPSWHVLNSIQAAGGRRQASGADSQSAFKLNPDDWKNHIYISQIKWEVNLLTFEDCLAFEQFQTLNEQRSHDVQSPSSQFRDTPQPSLPPQLLDPTNNIYVPTERSILNAVIQYIQIHEELISFGDCADTLNFILNNTTLSKIPKSSGFNPIAGKSFIVRPGSMLSVFANIAEAQSIYLQSILGDKPELLSALRNFCIQEKSLASAAIDFSERELSNHTELRSPLNIGYIPDSKEFLRKLYGDTRGIRLIGIDGYREIINLDSFQKFVLRQDDIQFDAVFGKSMQGRLGKRGISWF